MVAAVRTTVVLEPMAKDLPQAFPPTVSPAASADMESVMKSSFAPGRIAQSRAAIVAAAEPEMTPQISPITSLQNEDTRPAFRMSFKASPASGTFREAIE